MRLNSPKQSFCIQVGIILRHGPTVISIREIHGQICVVQNMVTLEQKAIPQDKLLDAYLAEELVICSSSEVERAHAGDLFLEDESQTFPRPIRDLSTTAIARGELIIKYLQALHKAGHTSLVPRPLLAIEVTRLAMKFGDDEPPSLSTLYGFDLQVRKAGGDYRVCYPNYDQRGGRGIVRWQQRAELAYQTVVHRLTYPERLPVRAYEVREDMQKEIIADPVARPQLFAILPSPSSVSRRIKADFGEYELYRRRYGDEAAKKKYADWFPRDSATLALEVVEFDDKDSRTFLWDEKTDLPCGRAFVTSGVDQKTNVPLGSAVSDAHRSARSAKLAFINSILPFRTDDPALSGMKTHPEFFGQFGISIFDNAMFNHASEFRQTIYDVSPETIVAFSQPRTPREKSCVENYNGRMDADFFSTLDGYGGPKQSKEFLSKGVSNACLSVQQFRNLHALWVYDIYCNDPQEYGLTPRQRWHDSMRNIKPRLPESVTSVHFALMARNEKRLRSEGLQLAKGLAYQNPELILLQRHLGATAKIAFRYDDYGLDYIMVFDPRTRCYFKVPSTTPEYANGLSLYQHRLVLKLCKDMGKRNPAIPELLQAKEDLRKLTRQLRLSKRRRDRVKGKRGDNDIDEGIHFEAPSDAPENEFVSDLEGTIDAIEQVEPEEGEEGWGLEQLE